MKVKVGNKIYNGEIEPVMVILTEQDKLNIKNMLPHCTKYCMFPDSFDLEYINKFMKENDTEKEGE